MTEKDRSSQRFSETVRYLPSEFLDLYEAVWTEAYGTGAVRWPDADSQTARVREGGAKRGKNAAARTTTVIKSEGALWVKDWLDRKLRALTREGNRRLNGSADVEVRQCAGRCKRMAENTWVWCPWCGGPTRTVDG